MLQHAEQRSQRDTEAEAELRRIRLKWHLRNDESRCSPQDADCVAKIQEVAIQIEKALSDFPYTRSVFAERATGGYFLDFTVNLEEAAPCGLTVGDGMT